MGRPTQQTRPPPAPRRLRCAVARWPAPASRCPWAARARSPSPRSTSSTRGSPAPRTRRRRSARRSTRTTAQLAAAQQQAIVAAQREAQLSAVLAAGREREAALEGEVTPRPRRARRGPRAAPALAQHALRPPRRDLPRRHARHARSCSRPTASTTCRPGPSTCAGSRRPTRRWSPACARFATRSQPSSPRSRRPSRAPRRSTSRSPPRATRSPPSAPRPRPGPRSSRSLRARAPGGGRVPAVAGRPLDRQVQRLERISAEQAQPRSPSGSATGRSPSRS